VAGGRHACVQGVSESSSSSLSLDATHAVRTAFMPRGLQVALLERGVYYGLVGRSGAPRRGPVCGLIRLWVGFRVEGWEDRVLWGLGWVEGSLHSSSFRRSAVGLTSVEVHRSIRAIPPSRVRAGRDAVRPRFRHSLLHASSPFGVPCTRMAPFTQSMRCGSNFTLSAHGQHRACPVDVARAYEGVADMQGLRWGSCGVRP